MLKRIAPIGVVSFALWGVGAALCQTPREQLPDAPSAQFQPQQQTLNAIVGKARASLYPGGVAANAQIVRRPEFALSNFAASSEKPPDTIFRKYLLPSPIKPLSSPSQASASLMGRATHAASGMIVSRDQSGKARLNTS